MLAGLLNGIIRFSLQNRLVVAALALCALLVGGWQALRLPIDVFPDLNRPRVVVMTEAPGLAPEEVETLVTFPLETALNGASGVQVVRSSSGVGLSLIYVEFDWGTDVYNDRQIVAERLATAADQLPEGISPQLAPISSIMGQIMIVAMYLDDDAESGEKSNGKPATSPMHLRTLADWVVRQQLLTIPGVAQVFVMGGERKQYQVLVDPGLLRQYGVTLHEVHTALARSNQNVTGGYLDEQGPHEYLVRVLGRVSSLDELRNVVVKFRDGRSVLLGQVANVAEGAQVKRGDSAAFVRPDTSSASGEAVENGARPAVVLTINKQPGADTRRVTRDITEALAKLERRLPSDVRIAPHLYQQQAFIDLAIENVVEALRDGSFLVVMILFLFLLNLRTTIITLTAIPLSIVVTALVFGSFGLTINTMTLGGLAVAIGELVDDAIVDVENIFRRLRENRQRAHPKPALLVVFQASTEIRNSIVYGTMIVVLVFIPLFALQGMEGRLFTPLGVAYIVSILSSLLVSLTVTPVLSYWLLPRARSLGRESDGLFLRALKRIASAVIGVSLRMPAPILLVTMALVIASGWVLTQLERDFLPPFNEGAVQVNVLLPPGSSLAKSNEIAAFAEAELLEVDAIQGFVRKTGRAELDEHAEGVNVTEFIASLDPEAAQSREEILAEIRTRLGNIPGVVVSVEQPLAHLISHMLSGVKAQVAIKLFGDDLDILRRKADEMVAAIGTVAGVRDLQVEPQVTIGQLRIEIDGHQLMQLGLTRADITEFVETAMQGAVVSEILEGQRKFDLLVRLEEPFREDLSAIRRLAIQLPDGGTAQLGSLATIYRGGGPNVIHREQARRRIVVQCNVAGRGLVDVVEDIQARLQPIVDDLPTGYFVEYGGQFESQRSASRRIAVLFAVALVGMFLVLYTMFRSANLALQVMVALPAAFIGSVAALLFTGQTLTVAAMVGFVSLCGIASRNGILLINHYLHLVQFEGEQWTPEMIVRAGRERLAPVLMTALTSGIGLVPLAMSAGEPGKEILYPVATVIIGGLVTSTIAEFLVRPALFWRFGTRSARRVTEEGQQAVPLVEEQAQQRQTVGASPGD